VGKHLVVDTVAVRVVVTAVKDDYKLTMTLCDNHSNWTGNLEGGVDERAGRHDTCAVAGDEEQIPVSVPVDVIRTVQAMAVEQAIPELGPEEPHHSACCIVSWEDFSSALLPDNTAVAAAATVVEEAYVSAAERYNVCRLSSRGLQVPVPWGGGAEFLAHGLVPRVIFRSRSAADTVVAWNVSGA
jgi:hypothetical protein